MVSEQAWKEICQELAPKKVLLVAVSKTKPIEDIEHLYQLGQRDFGENYVQELVEKQTQLPADIHWHFIGHLQTNKVKSIAPFVHLIHAVDSLKLLKEINKQATAFHRTINVLLQLHIAEEETKFGLNESELIDLLTSYAHEKVTLLQVRICGLMGMATFTENETQIRTEFAKIKSIFDAVKQRFFKDENQFVHCSMGMSGDYQIAVEEGSNLVRIGSLLFGSRA